MATTAHAGRWLGCFAEEHAAGPLFDWDLACGGSVSDRGVFLVGQLNSDYAGLCLTK